MIVDWGTPQVLDLQRIPMHYPVFLEFQDVIWPCVYIGRTKSGDYAMATRTGNYYMPEKAYNDSWRVWTAEPTEDQRTGTPWQVVRWREYEEAGYTH